MATSRKPSMGSTYVVDKRMSQWEELMRKFSEAHKEQCRSAPLKIPRAERSTKFFPTGSQYEGSWDVLGMSGYGEYTFSNGVVYKGDFDDGNFNGEGELFYKGGMVLRGKWKDGILTERKVTFDDNLEYNETHWDYCTMPDRRFAIEYEQGLKPCGKSYLTAEQPTRKVPLGMYDTGDGFYDPKTGVVYHYDKPGTILRSPSDREKKWILANCRVGEIEPLGPRPDLYEKWSEPIVNVTSPPPPAAGSKSMMTPLTAPSMFEQDIECKEFKHYDIGSPTESSTESDA